MKPCCRRRREMLADGDWLVPKKGGEPWLESPPFAAVVHCGDCVGLRPVRYRVDRPHGPAAGGDADGVPDGVDGIRLVWPSDRPTERADSGHHLRIHPLCLAGGR